jgi:hypothetical protein
MIRFLAAGVKRANDCFFKSTVLLTPAVSMIDYTSRTTQPNRWTLRTLTPKQEKQVKRILDHDVCEFVVTARCVKKRLLAFRNVRDEIVQQTFFRTGYAYHDRRRKAIIADK